MSEAEHRGFVEGFVARQLQIYELQPQEIVGHFNREESVINSYRGRQILELLQNADDAGANYVGKSRVLLSLTEDLVLVANTGEAFSRAGFESLFISDNSPKQLHRSQCIGNKGLGFRSVLSWTSAPLVLSGPNAIAFSAELAFAHASKLADRLPWLQQTFNDWTASEGRLPIPTMRFPFIPEVGHALRRVAEAIQKRGYDTVVLLPLLAGKYEEVLAQLRELSGETALFCRHLGQLTIETPEVNETWDVERDPEKNGIQPTIITHRREQRLWVVHRKIGCVSAEVLDERLRKTPSYEIAVAVPDEITPGTNHKLCVFFPTADILPMAMLVHATLDTDDNRKRLTDHAANREVLRHLGELISEVAESEAAKSSPARAFELLAGIERCDEELKEFGFLDDVLEACSQKKMFPRLDGRLSTADDVRSTSKSIWRRVADPGVFPEMFALEPTAATKEFIAAVGIDNYTEEELSRGLERLANQMPRAAAARVVGMLLANSAIPKNPLPSVLRDELGVAISASITTFLSPENQRISLPQWARDQISVLHQEFAQALRMALSVSTVRDLRFSLYIAGYDFEEFRFETLARRLEEIASGEAHTSIELQRGRSRDVLRCLFELSRADKDLGVIKAAVRIVTVRGNLRRADECYFGPDYEGHRLAHDLYQPFAEDEFVASPGDLGLADKPVAEVVEFLKRLGVLDHPRNRDISSSELRQHGLGELVDVTLNEAPDLSAAFGANITTAADVRRGFHDIIIDGVRLPDRFLRLLRQDNVEPLISFLGGAGAALFSESHAAGGELMAKQGAQRVHRSYQLRIPNPVRFLLINEPWVPCSDGERRRPEEIILHQLGSIVFAGTFFTHTIGIRNGRPVQSLADSVLLRLGAVYSLSALRPAEMYRLLEDLPERDPKGANAPGIYRSLLEHAAPSPDTPQRQAFLAKGMLWGRLNDHEAYYPVNQLRYSSRSSLPAPVRNLIPLVDIDSRRKASEVERIFGVQPVKPSDVVLTVEKTGIESRPWSCFVSERLTQALPYLYASRLARTTDEDGGDRRRLGAVSICVCEHFRAGVTVEGIAREDLSFDSELDGIVVDQTIFLVSLRAEVPRMSQSFWRAIGDLLAELVDAAVGADFASILACEAPDDMRDLLQRISDGRADELLVKARARLAMDLSAVPNNQVLELPPAPVIEVPAPTLLVTDEDDAIGLVQPDGELANSIFRQTDAPVRHAARKVRFSAGMPTARGGKSVVQVTDEQETIDIASRYEEQHSRFVVPVNHIHGYDGPRCDLLSVSSAAIRDRALESRSILLNEVERFIEVKGRNQRTGAVELTENELSGAEKFEKRYFIYRVFCDPIDRNSRELAILCDPINSPSREISRVARFCLDDKSGADWFQLVFQATDEGAVEITKPAP